LSLLNGTLQLGSVDNGEALCRRVLDDWLHAKNAYLNPTEHEDALSYLVAIAWELHLRFDPSKGTQSFSTFSYRILWRRVPSWYRQRFGDTRYRVNPTTVSFDEDTELGLLEQLDDVADVSIYSRINVDALSPDAKMVLAKIAEPMVEHDLSLEQLADKFGYSRRWVSRALERLRAELAYVVAT
jgi:DNA-directed RNA polymerase specialized sigma24 family protein